MTNNPSSLNEQKIRDELHKAYYAGLDRKGYSQFEEDASVAAIMEVTQGASATSEAAKQPKDSKSLPKARKRIIK
jgi:hypothetical protein